MNLARAQKALLAIQRCEHRQLHVRRAANEDDVREMVREGLVSATLSDSLEFDTVLGTVTDAGRRFLQMFPARFRFCDAR